MIWTPTGNPAAMIPPDGDAPALAGGCPSAVDAVIVRARETASEHPLFTDPYAEALLDGLGVIARDDAPGPGLAALLATRTKWFDEFFIAAGATGIAQVVVLAAGLESRPWRLPWLPDTVIFEIDRPHVLAYKSETMRAAGAQTRIEYIPVPVEADVDWSESLRLAGFEPHEPTAWAVEGVLPTLSTDAWNLLFDQITLQSSRGSRIAMDVEGPTLEDISTGLCCRGWDISSFDARTLMERYHREPPHTEEGPSTDGGYLEGRLG